MRWFHESMDRLQAAALGLAMPQAFQHGTTSPSLREHLEAVRLSIPPLTTQKRYRLTADTLAGPLACGYRVRLGSRSDLPVLIYHHGIAEMPYDKSFCGIFGWRTIDAHLVALQAPFHRTWWSVGKGLTTISRFMAMCAVSIALMEAIRRCFQDYGASQCLISGLSLGEFLSLMHHVYIGTANRCVPLLAGPDIAHTMLYTPLGRLITSEARSQVEHVQSLLDQRQAFQASDTRHIFPLLARYDLHMPYHHLHPCYLDCQVSTVTFQRGHITGSLSYPALRHHLLSCLEPLRQTATAGA